MTVFRTKKISEFTADPAIDGTETVVVAQSGSNYKATLAQILAWVQTQFAGIVNVFDLVGAAFDDSVAIPDGSVLTYTQSGTPGEAGTLDFNYMPVVHTYSVGGAFQTYATGYSTPGVHINQGAGILAANVNIDDWPIGVGHEFVQDGAGRITLEIGAGGTTPALVYLQCVDEAGAAVGLGQYNSIYTPVVRTIGQFASFTVRRTGTYRFLVRGNIEAI